MAKRLTRPKILRILREHGVSVSGFKWVIFFFDKVKPEDVQGDDPGNDPRSYRDQAGKLVGVGSEWSTYDDCAQLHISADAQDNIILRYSIYDGDLFDFGPSSLRFTKTFTIPKTYSHLFRDIAATRLQQEADAAWERHVRQWKRDWVENY
jgi:hypothetical protein